MSPVKRKQLNHAHRLGNSIVLVSALLVMLVIIATAYITRTNAGRITAQAVRAAESRNSNADLVAEMLAQVPADALFVEPVTPVRDEANIGGLFAPSEPANANDPRLPSRSYSQLYNAPAHRLNFDLNYPYNFVPNHDIPFTNWPDGITISARPEDGGYNLNPAEWPYGPGNPSGPTGPLALSFIHEGNPIGNPGFGDNRWMRDFEPVRIDLDSTPPFSGGADGRNDVFSHYKHLTYLGRPNNQWRVARDISDIFNLTGFGGLVEDLNIPIEQWPAAPNNQVVINGTASAAASGNSFFGINEFQATDSFTRWLDWSGSMEGYKNRLFGPLGVGDPAFAPGNFYRLRDLDANFYAHTNFDRPEDEFRVLSVGGSGEYIGTARNFVSRYLADTDGDGYTDAFWHLVPLPVKDGIRMIAAVSIFPNSAMINVNTATRFQYTDNVTLSQGGFVGDNSRTRGHTPSDIALVGGAAPGTGFGNQNVGFYDDPLNHYRPIGFLPGRQTFDYNPSRWPRHIEDVGLPGFGALYQVDRLDYWRRSGLDPLSTSSFRTYTPFSLGDDLELRMFSGQNFEWIWTRFEHSTQNNESDQLLRAAPAGLAETSEFGNQLSNRTYVADSRHRITMYNAVRNEEVPHWLQYRWARDINGNGFIDAGEAGMLPRPVQQDITNDPGNAGNIINNFYAQQRLKLDLREPVVDPFGNTISYFNGYMSLRERLPIALLHALDDGPRINTNGNRVGNSFHGPYSVTGVISTTNTIIDTNLGFTQRMAAAYAANILAYRDNDSDIELDDPNTLDVVEGPIPLSEVSLIADDIKRQFIGMEPQPFLTEAFIGHVYKALEVPATDFEGHEYTNAGNNVILHKNSRQRTVIVVQIANPFDEPIDLHQYKISLFEQEYDLIALGTNDRYLLPASAEEPNTAIFYAINNQIGGELLFREKWLDFLDIQAADLTTDTIVHRVPATTWSTDRAAYDFRGINDHAVELIRKVNNPDTGTFVDVVVDRIERGVDPDDASNTSRNFAEEVVNMKDTRPPEQLNVPADGFDVPPQGFPYQDSPQWDIGPDFDHWVQWVRITRAWGIDLDGDGIYQHDERSPRFVIGDATFHTAKLSQDIANGYPADDRYFKKGNRYIFAADPDEDVTFIGSPRPVPWFWRDYIRLGSTDTEPFARKPTFFDMNNGDTTDIPDKGWYSQGRPGVIRNAVDLSTLNSSGDITVNHNFPMQMAHKNGDFEQIGEVLNVWLWGHELKMGCAGNAPPCTYEYTMATFSEHMSRQLSIAPADLVSRARLNRLTAGKATAGFDTAAGVNVYTDPLAAVPNQAVGFRVLDLFVCDSYGFNPPGDLDGNGIVNEALDYELARFSNANGFTGRPVQGMINPNVAPPEVMRALPHWSRLVYENGNWSRSMLPEAVVQYRERFDADLTKPYVWRNQIDSNADGVYDTYDAGPNFSNRNNMLSDITNNMRGDRGFASIGELMMLTSPKQRATAPDAVDIDKWSIDYAGLNPYFRNSSLSRETVQLSTDVIADDRQLAPGEPAGKLWDEVAGDAEERNMLFAGASNMITTRTDTFTIYFRLRSFKQNPVTGRWDATDPEYIVDDSRYVMLIDRSNVNKPGDKPKILYFEKLPN